MAEQGKNKKKVLDYNQSSAPSPDWDIHVYRRIIWASLLTIAAILAILALALPHHPALWAATVAFGFGGVVSLYAS